jgi:hypothetical protein
MEFVLFVCLYHYVEMLPFHNDKSQDKFETCFFALHRQTKYEYCINVGNKML